MNIVMIGGGKNSLYPIEKAHELGMQVILVDDDPTAACVKAADRVISVRPQDTTAVIEALKDVPMDLCLAEPGGRNLIVCGAVNDAYELPGISAQTAAFCSDKYAFHNRMRNRKLRPGHCYLVNRDNIVNPFELEFPMIFKTRFGNEARSITLLDTPEQFLDLECELWGEGEEDDTGTAEKTAEKENVDAFKRRIKKYMEASIRPDNTESIKDDDYVLEEVLTGAEYSVDGVVEGCNFELVMLARKYMTPPPERVTVGYRAVIPGEDIHVVDVVTGYMGRVIQGLGMKDCIVHADLMVLGRKCTAVEVTAQPPLGHMHDEFIPMVTGIDLYRDFFSYMDGEAHNFSPIQTRRMVMFFFDMERCFLHHIPKPGEIKLPAGVRIKKWVCNLKMLDYMGAIHDRQSLLKRGYYILEGDSDVALGEATQIIKNSFEIK